MKTPREILLARHQPAEPKLDAVRRSVVGELQNEATKEQRSHLPVVSLFLKCSHKLWRELIWPCRRTWAGLAAAWLVIAVFNLSHSNERQIVAAKATAPPGEMRLALQEQHRVLAEIIGPSLSLSPAEPPRRPNHQPRSEHRSVATA